MEVHLQSSDASINLKALVPLTVLDKRVENPMDEMRRVRMDLHVPASPYIFPGCASIVQPLSLAR